jgi:hypothetical protein
MGEEGEKRKEREDEGGGDERVGGREREMKKWKRE